MLHRRPVSGRPKTVERGRSRHVALQLVDRQSHNAKHDVREDLRGAPDADMATAKLVLKPRVDPLNRGPVAVPDRLRVRNVDIGPRPEPRPSVRGNT